MSRYVCALYNLILCAYIFWGENYEKGAARSLLYFAFPYLFVFRCSFSGILDNALAEGGTRKRRKREKGKEKNKIKKAILSPVRTRDRVV